MREENRKERCSVIADKVSPKVWENSKKTRKDVGTEPTSEISKGERNFFSQFRAKGKRKFQKKKWPKREKKNRKKIDRRDGKKRPRKLRRQNLLVTLFGLPNNGALDLADRYARRRQGRFRYGWLKQGTGVSSASVETGVGPRKGTLIKKRESANCL